jgi:hypothetical protein
VAIRTHTQQGRPEDPVDLQKLTRHQLSEIAGPVIARAKNAFVNPLLTLATSTT